MTGRAGRSGESRSMSRTNAVSATAGGDIDRRRPWRWRDKRSVFIALYAAVIARGARVVRGPREPASYGGRRVPKREKQKRHGIENKRGEKTWTYVLDRRFPDLFDVANVSRVADRPDVSDRSQTTIGFKKKNTKTNCRHPVRTSGCLGNTVSPGRSGFWRGSAPPPLSPATLGRVQLVEGTFPQYITTYAPTGTGNS